MNLLPASSIPGIHLNSKTKRFCTLTVSTFLGKIRGREILCVWLEVAFHASHVVFLLFSKAAIFETKLMRIKFKDATFQ